MPSQTLDTLEAFKAIQPLAVPPDGIRHLLGDPDLSDVTIWRMEKRGFLVRVPGIRLRLYTVESVRRFVSGKATAWRTPSAKSPVPPASAARHTQKSSPATLTGNAKTDVGVAFAVRKERTVQADQLPLSPPPRLTDILKEKAHLAFLAHEAALRDGDVILAEAAAQRFRNASAALKAVTK